jgi:ABC-2 type transport system permease protein
MTSVARSARIVESPIQRLSYAWRSFWVAAWLGWQIESNWTDPFLFAIYSIIKPLSSAAILVVMYSIITQGNFASSIFSYIFLGTAFYTYVGSVMTGVSWAVADDRERYRTLKYIYVGPISVPIFLAGRGVARFLTASASVLITVLFGVIFFKIRIDPLTVHWPLFIGSLAIGVIMLAMMGLILAGITLVTARHSGMIGEATAGALYIFSGAIIPLDVLPEPLKTLGFLNPITYWLELIRRSLVGTVADAFPTLRNLDNLQLLLILCGLSVILMIVSIVVFRACDLGARERGLIDQTTNY